MPFEKVVIGDAVLYWADCREVLPGLTALLLIDTRTYRV